MTNILLYPVVTTASAKQAVSLLHKYGISTITHPAPEITHLMLDVPSFNPEGSLRSGDDLEIILERIPPDITVIGGNLTHPALAEHRKLDLLQDEAYLARNAAISADCALRIAAPLLKTTFQDTSTLILGWGRIGKCLAGLLKALGAPVTVAVRSKKDLAMLQALGYAAVDYSHLPESTQLVFNTVPGQNFENISGCVKIDLASQRSLPGEDVIWARGLPGIIAPETSGRLIAETILRLFKEESS